MRNSSFDPWIESKEERNWREIDLTTGIKNVFDANDILDPRVVVVARDRQRETYEAAGRSGVPTS